MFFTIQRLWLGNTNKKKIGTARQGNLSACHPGQACLRFTSPDLEHGINMFGTRNLNTTKPFNFPICTWIQNGTQTAYA